MGQFVANRLIKPNFTIVGTQANGIAANQCKPGTGRLFEDLANAHRRWKKKNYHAAPKRAAKLFREFGENSLAMLEAPVKFDPSSQLGSISQLGTLCSERSKSPNGTAKSSNWH